MPALLGNEAPQRCLTDILAAARETGQRAGEEWYRQLSLTLARNSAIPYGKALSTEEMQDLLKRLFALPTYGKTPDGKAVVSLLKESELENRFIP